MNKLTREEINNILNMLNDRWCDPYVEVPCVNLTLRILHYDGHFNFNDVTNKVTYKRGCDE